MRPSNVDFTLRTIFKRCLKCPPESPTCPDCRKNEICSLVPQGCDACAYMTCIENPSPAPQSQKTNVGAIAGGVIGGVALVGFVMFMLWRFGIKKRREQQELEAEEWEEDDIAQQKHRGFNAMRSRSDAASTRTKASLAGSFLSRASNIIQIAYIPGVTNRNRSGHNSLLTTPVPPIPAMYANTKAKSPLANQDDALFFRPGDLRGSTYSGNSSIGSGNRDTQYSARSANNRDTQYSITPSLARSSMFSEVYHDDATADPMPALTVMRGAPRMVSVKSSAASTPPASSGSSNSGSVNAVMIGQSSATSSSPSSLRAKATQISVGGNKDKGRFPVKQTNTNAPAVPSPLVETATESDEEEEEHARARRSLVKQPPFEALPLIQPIESPFFDATETDTPASSAAQARPNPYATMAASVRNSGQWPKRTADRGLGGLSAVMEEAAAKRASEAEDGDGRARDGSPFSDVNAIK